MRKTTIKMVEKTITTTTCDYCDFTTDHNRGCCGMAPVMSCHFCGQDCCKDHRKTYWEHDYNDYPDMVLCSSCIPKGDVAWEMALETAGRYDDMVEVAEKIFKNEEIDNA